MVSFTPLQLYPRDTEKEKKSFPPRIRTPDCPASNLAITPAVSHNCVRLKKTTNYTPAYVNENSHDSIFLGCDSVKIVRDQVYPGGVGIFLYPYSE